MSDWMQLNSGACFQIPFCCWIASASAEAKSLVSDSSTRNLTASPSWMILRFRYSGV